MPVTLSPQKPTKRLKASADLVLETLRSCASIQLFGHASRASSINPLTVNYIIDIELIPFRSVKKPGDRRCHRDQSSQRLLLLGLCLYVSNNGNTPAII